MNIVWFKNDLRTQDNHSLFKAVQENQPVVAVYFFDPKQFKTDRFGFKKTEKYRAQFLIETVQELRSELKKLNISLLIYTEEPETKLPELIEKYEAQKVYLQNEWTFEERLVIDGVKANCEDSVAFIETYDQFLIHPDDLPYSSFSKIPEVFTQWRKKCEKQADIRQAVAVDPLQPENLVAEETQIPSLDDLGLESFEVDERTAFPFKGGALQALKRIENYFWETKNLARYKKTRNGLVGKDYSSKLSAWLANGSISPRTIYYQVQKFEKEETKNDSTYWLIFELYWRDFFKYVSLKHGDKIFHLSGILEKDYDWSTNKAAREEWIEGRTKYDFVNANMKEIALTGFMSNRGRQNVASFWAKELQQDWRIGAAYFESMLIDYDVHSNYGNWLYNSGVGNDPRDRKFNIESQADRYDGDRKYRDLWLAKTLFD
ncbi:DASH family cryptochrome [Leeuwenhoekiella sp. H156]|uniref:DASH family cryptochrome n=1 Tax=Leeuwenhoekiella sp. H156 TaxID=3450128 RepID=UPI003FA40DB2